MLRYSAVLRMTEEKSSKSKGQSMLVATSILKRFCENIVEDRLR